MRHPAATTLAGASFLAMASGPEPSTTALGGYVTLGGLFFLVSAIRLHLAARAA
ncbi:hypothetical protein [Nocardioides caldifontis]|uniref:hypothetical protein n=1 Tax=Nocardioides caldifontis TaxID=2588938 RepID=UPI001396B6EE|nr:hypothetical protein [Nocardioides caldifontis]